MSTRFVSFVAMLLVLTLVASCAAPTPTVAPAKPTPTAMQTPVGSQKIVEITDFIEALASKDQFSGAVLIAKDGVPILKQAYGLANRSFDVPNRIDTKFNLGSMNKMFTAVAILQLVEKGKLTLDGRIIEYVPDYANKDVANKVTLHHLLTHTSGLGDYFTAEFKRMSKDRFKDVSDYLPLFVEVPLQFELGTQFSYSNAGFMVLGLIIERVTGQSYFDYVRKNIYEPCGIVNTDAYEVDYVVPNLAMGYTREGTRSDGTLKNNLFTHVVKGGPAGGGYSTVQDLLNFSNALLSHKLLSPEMTGVLLEGKVSRERDVKYAYGFEDRVVENHCLVGHGGRAEGICGNLDIFLDQGYTVAVLANMDGVCVPVYVSIRQTLLR
jgi:D-alanyl-D-alanine carboxypeptidase